MTTRKVRNAMTAASDKAGRKRGSPKGISEQEVEDVEEMSSPRTPVIYEVVRRLGDEEMERPATSLWWSGVAAGLSISFSLLAQAILQAHLPDAPWRPLVSGFGYCVGFLMVVLGNQQLFTESTITVVLPVFKDLSWKSLWRMATAVGNRAGGEFRRHAVRGGVLHLHARAAGKPPARHARPSAATCSTSAGGPWPSAASRRAS